ncbi:MAG: hypothetical protein R6T96_13350 [Longimicrobiales bacterium]
MDPGVRDAYFRAVGEYFQVAPEEVSIIGEWEVTPDEVPVVLFLAHRAGVSPDVLIGLRRGGRPWQEVGRRFGIQTTAFHLSLPEGAEKGRLTRAYEAFQALPAWEWQQIRLEDEEVIALVNLRVLADQTGVPPLDILEGFRKAGSFVACYPLLLEKSEG